MNRPIPTKLHGILDYLSVPTLLTLPRALGWGKKITNLLTGSALGVLAYSLVTRYELGLLKVLPMKGHLGLDLASGAMLMAAPFTFLKKRERTGIITGVLAGFGAFEITAALLTQTHSSVEQASVVPEVPQWVDQLRTEGLRGVLIRH